MKGLKLYWTLFVSSLIISATTFGGGYVIVSVMRKHYVNKLKWLTDDEMLNLVAIGQISPGAFTINTNIVLGHKFGGFLGAIVCVIGTVIPPLIIISLLSYAYEAFRDNLLVAAIFTGMQAAIAAVICNVVVDLGAAVIKSKRIINYLVMIAAFVCVFFFDIAVYWVILGSILISIVTTIIGKHKQGVKNNDLS